MTDKKFTDEEIAEALECCSKCDCKHCPCYAEDINGCKEIPTDEILALINRQRAEIERLKNPIPVLCVDELTDELIEVLKKQPFLVSPASNENVVFLDESKIKSEAVKEFAERLKKRLERKYTIFGREYVLRHLRELVKEMTEERAE